MARDCAQCVYACNSLSFLIGRSAGVEPSKRLQTSCCSWQSQALRGSSGHARAPNWLSSRKHTGIARKGTQIALPQRGDERHGSSSSSGSGSIWGREQTKTLGHHPFSFFPCSKSAAVRLPATHAKSSMQGKCPITHQARHRRG